MLLSSMTRSAGPSAASRSTMATLLLLLPTAPFLIEVAQRLLVRPEDMSHLPGERVRPILRPPHQHQHVLSDHLHDETVPTLPSELPDPLSRQADLILAGDRRLPHPLCLGYHPLPPTHDARQSYSIPRRLCCSLARPTPDRRTRHPPRSEETTAAGRVPLTVAPRAGTN